MINSKRLLDILGSEEWKCGKSINVYADKFDHVDQLTHDLTDDGFYVRSVTTELKGVNTFSSSLKSA